MATEQEMVPCDNCDGTGRELVSVLHPERGYETCGDCGGSGQVPAVCPGCEGTGERPDPAGMGTVICPDCEGSGEDRG